MKNVIFILALFLTFNLLIAAVTAPPTNFTGPITATSYSGGLNSVDVLAAMPVGFSYLTTSTCSSGYSAVESGYIKLGVTPNTSVTGSDTRDFQHTHGLGSVTSKEHYHSESGPGASLGADSGGASHSHTADGTLKASHSHSNTGTNGAHVHNLNVIDFTPSGSTANRGMVVQGAGSRASLVTSSGGHEHSVPTNNADVTGSTSSTTASHTHSISGNVGDVTSGNNGDLNLSLNGSPDNSLSTTENIEPSNITMRLCVKNP